LLNVDVWATLALAGTGTRWTSYRRPDVSGDRDVDATTKAPDTARPGTICRRDDFGELHPGRIVVPPTIGKPSPPPSTHQTTFSSTTTPSLSHYTKQQQPPPNQYNKTQPPIPHIHACPPTPQPHHTPQHHPQLLVSPQHTNHPKTTNTRQPNPPLAPNAPHLHKHQPPPAWFFVVPFFVLLGKNTKGCRK